MMLGQERQKLQRVEQVRFAARVGANDRRKGLQIEGEFLERLESVDLDTGQHILVVS